MSRDSARELPILTDVVELHATGSFPKPERPPEPEIAICLRACCPKRTSQRCRRCS